MGPKATCFEDLGFNEEVLSALKEMNISVPTEIQYIGVPAMMQGRSVVLGSHTGSGKTLAYLLPLVQVSFHKNKKIYFLFLLFKSIVFILSVVVNGHSFCMFAEIAASYFEFGHND